MSYIPTTEKLERSGFVPGRSEVRWVAQNATTIIWLTLYGDGCLLNNIATLMDSAVMARQPMDEAHFDRLLQMMGWPVTSV